MRFTRKQLNEATTRAYVRGKRSRKMRGFFIFVLGIAIGSGGLFSYIYYGERIRNLFA